MSTTRIEFTNLNYWELITKISYTNNLSIKDSVKLLYSLIEFPHKNIYSAIISVDYLIPYGVKVEITNNINELEKHSIPAYYAGIETVVEGIICMENKKEINIIYALKDCDGYLLKKDLFEIKEV